MPKELNRFLQYLRVEKGFSQGTIEAYQLDIGKGLIPFLRQRSKFRAEEITKYDIRAYLDYVAVERGNSAITRARKLAAIKSFFNYLVENEGLEANPAASIRSPRVPEKEPVYLNEEECLRFLQTIARKGRPKVRERDMAMAVLLLHTGLRVSELTNLKLPDVDLDRGQIKITRKGDKEQYIHLNSEAVRALAKYLHSCPHYMRLPRFARNDRRFLPQSQNGRFFVGTKGQNLGRTYIYEVVRRYLKLAGINKGKQGPHLLRHTFCTRLHQKGVSPFVIKELAGHKSLNTTMRYIKIENKEQAEALDRLEFGAINL
jgi:site-specific recombinase XerD